MQEPNNGFSLEQNKSETNPIVIFIGVCFGISLLVFSGVQIWDRVKLHSLGDEMIEVIDGISDESNTIRVMSAENSKLKNRVASLERSLRITTTELQKYKNKEKSVLGTFGDAVRIEGNGTVRYESTSD